jgi:hypothetical protein
MSDMENKGKPVDRGCSSTRAAKKEAELTGVQVRRLMRVNKLTIRGLAKAMGITQTRVRKVRALGVSGEVFVRDWTEALCKAFSSGNGLESS